MSIRLADIAHIMERWAPVWTAWDRDNVGLQVGRFDRPVRKILVALDVTADVVREAITGKFDLILSHHPLLYRTPKTFTDATETGRLALTLAEHRIAQYAAHTNLDAAPGGVSTRLAETLGLTRVRFLAPLSETLSKIVVFVPASHVAAVRDAMTKAGAGVIGEYSSCSFQTTGAGTFRGSPASQPFAGKAGELESTEEVRLEMVCPRARAAAVAAAMREIHPYEEPAYDLYEVSTPDPNAGMGAVGELPRPMTVAGFLRHVKLRLHADGVRWAGPAKQNIRRVAVCGGGGSEMLGEALRANADAFVTADVTYHIFHSAADRLLLVDAGHYETEQVILRPMADAIRTAARDRGERLTIEITKHVTNPVRWAK